MIDRLGIQKTSFVDFPGKIATVVFLPGCNFRCPYCHNAGLVDGRDMRFLNTKNELFAHLEKRRNIVSGVAITGGEPALYDDLPDFMSELKQMGFAVKTDTNGSNPEIVRRLKGIADYIAMDVKTDPEGYTKLWPDAPQDVYSVLSDTMCAIRSLGIPYEFRVTLAPGFVDVQKMKTMSALFEPDDLVVLQPFRAGETLDPEWSGLSPLTESETKSILDAVRSKCPKARLRGMS